jgi:hypothetical protein
MSLVQDGLHYVMDIQGTEELYDLTADPDELSGLKTATAPGEKVALGRFRSVLYQALTGNRVANQVAGEYQQRLRMVLESMLLQQPGGASASSR